MKRVLIGHRGAGKTSLLEKHQQYFQDVPCFDLDQVISEREHKSIAELFTERGESLFRDLEKVYFSSLIKNEHYVISVGAGFHVDSIPPDAEVIYVSRRTDSDGRLFLNRPRLNPELSPLEEYKLRYQEREPRFRQRASWVYHLAEGVCDADEIEEAIFKKSFSIDKAYLTLQNEKEIFNWPNLNKFELRSDIFSAADIQRIVQKYHDKKFLVAIRNSVNVKEYKDLKVDWALELGNIPEGLNVQIVSLHEGHVGQFEKFSKNRHLKFSPVINSWNDLMAGYSWQQQDPANRSFLPRTSTGLKSRWRWMRNLMWTRQKINFVQGLKDFDDQPSFYEYIQWQKAHKQFGAVLGYPIHHSRTPVTQGLNMQDYGPILAIPLEESDFELAFIFLQQLGLKFAAVTSPLKLKAAALVGHKISEEGINSIFFDGQKWLGISSDADGFATAIEESGIEDISSLSIAIWGGGGVIASIKQVLPAAIEFSSRTGKRRDNANDSDFKPDMVIWAAPRHNDVVMPPNDWKPRYIVDLNYIENSLGLEYAQSQAGATYMSGLDMFYAQAKKQFKFWATQFISEAHEKEGRI